LEHHTNTVFDPLSLSELLYFYVALIQQGAESILSGHKAPVPLHLKDALLG